MAPHVLDTRILSYIWGNISKATRLINVKTWRYSSFYVRKFILKMLFIIVSHLLCRKTITIMINWSKMILYWFSVDGFSSKSTFRTYWDCKTATDELSALQKPENKVGLTSLTSMSHILLICTSIIGFHWCLATWGETVFPSVCV